jgi:putative transposase
LVDTLGNLLGIKVLPADISDRAGARVLLEEVAALLPRLRHLWADQGYTGEFVDWVTERFGWTVEIVTKLAGQVGFVPLPKRWIVERSFGWYGRYRRLARDFEYWGTSTEALVYIASIHLMLKRLARAT